MLKPLPATFTLQDFDFDSLQKTPLNICSYLPDRASQLTYLLLDKDTHIDSDLYTKLSQNGFRRSGEAFYKPNCHHCLQCISARIPVNDFKLTRRFRKVLKRNKDVVVNYTRSYHATSKHFSLYAAYIDARHADGDMYPPSLHTFERFLVNSVTMTNMFEIREPSGKLIAVAVTDEVNDGLSSIYTFYNPTVSYQNRSLGVLSILKQIEMAQQIKAKYVYLGYWIPSVRKMNYKTDFLPIELLINNEWIRFETSPNADEIIAMLNTTVINANF